MLKKNNNVHLDGLLEAFKILPDSFNAWASVVTLHPKPGMENKASASDRDDRIHHEVRLIGDEKSFSRLESIASAFESVQSTGSVYACSLDGFLFSNDKIGSFVVCDPNDFQRVDTVKRNANNNRVNIVGEVVSTVYSDETARISLKTDEGTLSSFILRRENQAAWDMVVDGKIARGDTLSVSGPLMSGRMTNGQKTIPSCMISPHVLKKQNVLKQHTRRGMGIG